jgi:hypothetical protein
MPSYKLVEWYYDEHWEEARAMERRCYESKSIDGLLSCSDELLFNKDLPEYSYVRLDEHENFLCHMGNGKWQIIKSKELLSKWLDGVGATFSTQRILDDMNLPDTDTIEDFMRKIGKLMGLDQDDEYKHLSKIENSLEKKRKYYEILEKHFRMRAKEVNKRITTKTI